MVITQTKGMLTMKSNPGEIAENLNGSVSDKSLTVIEPADKDQLRNLASIAQPTGLSP